MQQTEAPAGNFYQIRDIIFGAQMRGYDRRFAQLEERLLKDPADLREELRNRLNSPEEFMRRELDFLSGRITDERRNRNSQVQELGGSVEQLGRTTGRRFVDSVFSDKYLSTIGVKIDRKTVELGETTLNLMPTSGARGCPSCSASTSRTSWGQWGLSATQQQWLKEKGWTMPQSSVESGEGVEEAFLTLSTRMIAAGE